MRRRAATTIVLALAAALALTILPAATAQAGASRVGEAYWEWTKGGNFLAGYLTGSTYGVEVWSDTTGETRYFYGAERGRIEWGAKRVRVYFIRLYAFRADGSRVLLARRETDALSYGGAWSIRTPGAYTSNAPCDLRVATREVTRWNNDTTSTRTHWSDYFSNYMNPNCA